MLLQSLFQFSPIGVLVGVVVLAVGWGIYEVHMNYKIRRLGRKAAIKRSWSYPFGFDFVYESIKAARKHLSYECWKSRTERLGNTFEFLILGKRIIFTADPENIKAILAAQFHDFGKGEEFHKNWKEFLGDSIFTTDGAQWHASRQLIRPQFVKDRVSDLHIFEKHIQKLMALIPKDGSTVDMSDLLFRFSLDAATEFLLGESVDSLDRAQVAFAESFAEVQRIQSDFTRLGPLQKFAGRRKFRKHLAVLNKFVKPFVERVVQIPSEELKTKAQYGYNFLHALAEFTKDRQMLRDQIVAILIAARDTTAGTLAWAVYELSKKPECVEKLRTEIMEHVGPLDPPSYTHLKEMKYLQHILNETLRLYPSVPFNSRIALKDTTLPTGGGPSGRDPIGVLKGTPIAYSALIMQRRRDLFGDDVEEFKPERWDNWSSKMKQWQYIPFNGGPRICVGQQYALTEMGYVLVRLFQNFESLENRQGKEKQFMRTEVTISPGAGVKVAFK